MAASRTIETRVLILTELSADARRLADLVRDARVTAKITNENDLATDLRAGVGLLVATDETLSIPVLSCIKAWGDEQPEWSALPVLALVHPRDELVEPLRYLLAADDMAGCTVTVLDRPAQPDVLKNAIKSGLQSRRRQYRIRDQIVALDKEKEHTEFLAREIQHRAKNNIAILQGLLGRLGDRTTDIDDLIERFGTRAAAVARTIDVLCRKHWRGSDLEDLLTAELKALSPGTPSDFRLNGEAFELTADATFALHLVFHELATNALKHGAFAETGGNVTVC